MHLIMNTESKFTNKKDDYKHNDNNATEQSQHTNQNANNSIVSSSYESANNNTIAAEY